ncbi:hypothetical protein [Nonlabens sp. Asnod3-H03]|uniref:hypothetical protein n=1 Tax=Nonlabens sp. Asnod3-H03 TaxID=3160580 RepID=UPI00386F207D
MNYYKLILLFLVLPFESDYCTCPPPRHWEKAASIEYEYSEVVFVGDVKSFSNDKNKFTIEVCEVFKGDLKSGQIILGKNLRSCYPYIDRGGSWLLFGNHSQIFEVNECGISSNIEKPRQLMIPIKPPSVISKNRRIEEKTQRENDAKEAMQNLLTQLRNIVL